MNDDLFGRDYNTRRHPPERDNLFLWTILILLLIGLAMACWLGSFYVFGHPEKPESYHFLQKIHKLDPPKRFELTKAPAGDFLTPQKAFDRYASMSRFELQRENEALIRDYINNYQATKRLVPYITGRFSIMDAYELKKSDYFGSGIVALAQSADFPQVVIEHVYTAGPDSIPVLEQMLATGLDIKLEKTMDLSAIVQVTRMFDGRLEFTVVPLLYGSYALKQGSGSFSLDPPATLNPAAGLPIVRGDLLQDGLKAFSDYMKKHAPKAAIAGITPAAPVAHAAAETTIVRVETSPTPSPAPAETPAAVAVATPKPQPTAKPEETEQAEATPAQSAEIEPKKAAATPAAVVEATPTPAKATPSVTPAAVAAATPKVPLKPFLVSAPTPGMASTSGGNWRTYAPGRMPRGRLVSVGDVSDLADRGTGGERLYLRGNFVVTATGEAKAVLRVNSGTLGNALASVTKQGSTRVIVEFPAGVPPPAERSSLARDETRPFEVRDIRRDRDGQINIFVREVTTP